MSYTDVATEANALALALELGGPSVAQAAGWADSVISAHGLVDIDSAIDASILAISRLAGAEAVTMAAALRQVPGIVDAAIGRQLTAIALIEALDGDSGNDGDGAVRRADVICARARAHRDARFVSLGALRGPVELRAALLVLAQP